MPFVVFSFEFLIFQFVIIISCGEESLLSLNLLSVCLYSRMVLMDVDFRVALQIVGLLGLDEV